MSESKIEPHRITKPIQLLGAWLAGLAIINSSFLVAAATIKTSSWIPALLAIAAVANVPLFILSLFLLQTKFRPEMQEDIFYSQYLERQYGSTPVVPPIDVEKNLEEVARKILLEVPKPEGDKHSRVMQILKESEIEQLQSQFELSRSLSELYLFPSDWKRVAKAWKDDPTFKQDVEGLKSAGLITYRDNEPSTAELTAIGRQVAEGLKQGENLWNQKNKIRGLQK